MITKSDSSKEIEHAKGGRWAIIEWLPNSYVRVAEILFNKSTGDYLGSVFYTLYDKMCHVRQMTSPTGLRDAELVPQVKEQVAAVQAKLASGDWEVQHNHLVEKQTA